VEALILLKDDAAHSYPTTKSRLFALLCLAVIWVSFGARALRESWAPSPVVTLAVAAGLFALSKNFNVNVHFRAASDGRERRFIHRLSVLKGVGAVGTLISIVWLWAGQSSDIMLSFVVPLFIFLISFGLQAASAVLYRPFVIADASPE
jgi:hypothetical protein